MPKEQSFRGDNPPPQLSPGQWLALAVGASYLLAGLAGFFVTGFDDVAHHDTGERLLGLELNPLHNVVHLAIGLAGVALWRSVAGALTYGVLLAVGYGAAFVYGLVALGSDWDVLSLNAADNGLHLVSALVGGGIVAACAPAVRDPRRTARTAA